MGRIVPRSFAALLLAGVACAAPALAPAATKMKLVLAGSDGVNQVQLAMSETGDLLISSPAGVSAPPAPCTLDSETQASCPAGSISQVRAAFLDGDDTL